MHHGAAQPGAGQKRLPTPDRQARLRGVVAERDRLTGIVLHQRLAHIKPQLIMDAGALELRHREARAPALEPDHLVTRGSQLLREDAADHTNTTDYDINFGGVIRVDHVPTLEGDFAPIAGYSHQGRLHAIGYMAGLRDGLQAGGELPDQFRRRSGLFVEALDVDDVIAGLLVTEGFNSVEELAVVDEKEIAGIEGFDEDTARELQARARDYLGRQEAELDAKRQELGVEDALKEVPGSPRRCW